MRGRRRPARGDARRAVVAPTPTLARTPPRWFFDARVGDETAVPRTPGRMPRRGSKRPRRDRGRVAPRVDAADRGLVRIVRDVALAEDLAQDTIVAALAEWRLGHSRPAPRMADDGGEAAGDRHVPQSRQARRGIRSDGARALRGGRRATPAPASTTSRTTCCASCSSAAPGAHSRGTDHPDPEARHQSLDPGDRPGLPRPRSDGRPARLARKPILAMPEPRSRSRPAPSGPSASPPCSGRSCSSTRATRDRGRRLDAPRPVRRGRAPRARPHGPGAR